MTRPETTLPTDRSVHDRLKTPPPIPRVMLLSYEAVSLILQRVEPVLRDIAHLLLATNPSEACNDRMV